jgi:hypothetical protein
MAGRQCCVCDVEITWNWPELSAIRVLFAAIGKHDKETSLPTILRLIRTARPPADWWFPSAVRLSLLFSICTVRLLTVCWTHWLGYRACVFFFLLFTFCFDIENFRFWLNTKRNSVDLQLGHKIVSRETKLKEKKTQNNTTTQRISLVT